MARVKVGEENGEAIELHYVAHGSGDPVVLIHGWPLSGRSWEQQAGPLIEAGHQVISYDRRGFGLSTQPFEGYDYDTFAADLNALLEQLDVRGATLVGFSMGGGEVVRYISRYGTDRVSKAVLAGAVPPYLYKSDDNPDGGIDDATLQSFQDAIRSDRVAFIDGFLKNFFAAGDRTDLVSEPTRQYLLDIAAYASPKGTLDCTTAFTHTDFRADLEKVTVPTLVIHGDSDAIVPFEVSGKRAHEALADSQLVVVEGGPHGFNVTHAEEFNRALIDFLKA